MSRYPRVELSSRRSFPRVSGDEPLGFAFGELEIEFSPRERG